MPPTQIWDSLVRNRLVFEVKDGECQGKKMNLTFMVCEVVWGCLRLAIGISSWINLIHVFMKKIKGRAGRLQQDRIKDR